jgi:hypothetical protein
VGTKAGWFSYDNKPINLGADPSPQDRLNLRFAGFQIYYGLFPHQVEGLRTHLVQMLILPLWPMLLCAIPPWLWWRRRRRTRGRGFSVLDRDTRCDSTDGLASSH